MARYARSSRDQGQDVSGLLRLRLETGALYEREAHVETIWQGGMLPSRIEKKVQLSHYALL